MSGSVFASPPYSLEDPPLTPKIQNKRRSHSNCEPITDTSSSNDDGGSPSSFDCQSLQRSLKRVRLTSTNTTPGELRLERDLRHAVFHQLWIPRSFKDEWQVVLPAPSSNSSDDAFTEYLSNGRNISQDNFTVTVTRDEQDPMELLLRVQEDVAPSDHRSSLSSQASSTTLHLHIPRLYPHRPPVVRRIDHTRPRHSSIPDASPRLTPRSDHPSRRWVAGQFSHAWERDVVPAASRNNDGASSLFHHPHRCGRLKCPSQVQSIVIASSPETSGNMEEEDAPHASMIRITQWTPVHRITDLVRWLVEAIVEGAPQIPMDHAVFRDACDEKKEEHRPFGLQYSGRGVGSFEQGFYRDDDSEDRHRSYQGHGGPEDWISDGEETTKTSSRRRPELYDLADPSTFLPPNRFHIGYTRSNSKESLTNSSLGDNDEDAMDISLHCD